VIVSDENKRLIKAPPTVDMPTMKKTARLVIVPRNIDITEKKAPTTPLTIPTAKNFMG